MNLFRLGDFLLSSGRRSCLKIDCDALTRDDWNALALIAASILPPFSSVEGVPTGGLAFADALRVHYRHGGVLLLADDVLTSGCSMIRQRGDREAIGVVAFARGPCPSWVTPLFTLADGVP